MRDEATGAPGPVARAALGGPLGAVTVPLLSRSVAEWIAARRAEHRERAGPLPASATERLAGHYPRTTLEDVRMEVVGRVVPPGWLGLVERVVGTRTVAFDRLWGITLADTILVLDRVPEGRRVELLFHELVHVVQYRELGVRGFARRYVRGWVDGGASYGAIPLERDAYALQRRFRAGEAFDAEAETVRLLGGRPQ